MASNSDLPNTCISEWISGQTLFITGSSGAIGKVFLYKLLKSCAGVKAIYILLRTKKGKCPNERLDQLFSSSMFDKLKKEDPTVFKKVRVIQGDVSEKYLGINESDWDLLQREVTLFFNAAASVRFDDSLQKALFTNTRSAKYALLLAKGMKHLKAFVHVSTLYCNCHLYHIPEEVIPTGSDPDKMIQIAESFEEYELEFLCKKIIDKFPNTYVYTKNMAEELVYKYRDEIPLVIYRPGIVNPSAKEPEPGWCETFNGITALAGAAGKGVLRVFLGDNKGVFELINTDACVNGMIVSAWYRDVHFSLKEPIDRNIVFNAKDYEFSIKFFHDWMKKHGLTHPFRDSLWHGQAILVRNHFIFRILVILLHLIPGLMLDFILKLLNRKPMLVNIYRKMHTACLNLEYFMSNQWKVENKNFKKLNGIVPEKEKKIFFVESLHDMDFEKMMLSFAGGVRKLYGLPAEVEKEDIKHGYRMYYIDLVFKLVLVGLLLWMLPLKTFSDYGMTKLRSYQEEFKSFLTI